MPTPNDPSTSSKPRDPSVGSANNQCHVANNFCGEGYMNGVADMSKGQHGPEDKLEPIAIVGMAVKFPQDATSPESFWQMMMGGHSAKTDVPPERFEINGFHHPKGNQNSQVSGLPEGLEAIAFADEILVGESEGRSFYSR